jgi:FemAB family protein
MFSVLEKSFNKNSLELKKFKESEQSWSNVLSYSHTSNCLFENQSIEYFIEYFSENANFDCLSSVIFHNNNPVAIIVLEVNKNDKGFLLTSNGGNVKPPVYKKGLSNKLIKKINASLFSFIELATEAKYTFNLEYEISQMGCSAWYMLLLENYKVKELSHNLYIDLKFSIEDIKLNFRKSYKPLITKGIKLWKTQVIDYNSCDIDKKFIELKKFHILVSGRQTRSNKSWDIQASMVKSGKAFVVSIYDNDNLEGFGLFMKNNRSCSYAVGVYNREKFDLPLGHVVQYQAIKIMKDLNLDYYHLGLKYVTNQQQAATDKDLSISRFKDGFANLILPTVIFG